MTPRALGRIAVLVGVVVSVLAAPADARAHELGALQVTLSWAEPGRLAVTLEIDGEHLPPGLVPPSTAWAERGRIACERARAGSRLSTGGRPVDWVGAPEEIVNEPSGSPYWRTRLVAELPASVHEVAYVQSAKLGQFAVLSSAVAGTNAPLRWGEPGGEPVVVPLGGESPARSWLAVARQYVALGFRHIVPEGLDHVCFVLGLFLLALRLRPLLVQVTCFTVAHTLTLALATLGLVRLPPAVVEPLIALSIAYVGVENLLTRELRPWRPALVFGFGLLHGMGFAGVLADVGIARRELAPALLAFNLGVEGGQLAVLAAAFVLVGLPFGEKPWYRTRIAIPGSLAVAGLGLFWFVQRLIG